MSQYNATYAHLINHSLDPNAEYEMYDHPRFGRIRSVTLKRDMSPGDEVFCDYGYTEKFLRTEKAVRSVYKIGRWISNKTEEEFRQDLKHHINYIRDVVQQYKPVLSMLASVLPIIN